jgi:anhydro-N-acetylmuramic acid kinase
LFTWCQFGLSGAFFRLAAYQISKNILDNEKVLISGGGSFNKTLIKSLTNYGINISRPNDIIINYKESLIFALLGYLRLNNEINCLKSVTGATRDHSSGDIFS